MRQGAGTILGLLKGYMRIYALKHQRVITSSPIQLSPVAPTKFMDEYVHL